MEETGYGEFEIVIKIFFKPPFQNSSVESLHELKFHPTKSSKQLFTHQYYDELVLQNCDQSLIDHFEQLKHSNEAIFANLGDFTEGSGELIKQFNSDKKENLHAHEELLTNAIEYVNDEIRGVRDKILKIEEEINAAYNEGLRPSNDKSSSGN